MSARPAASFRLSRDVPARGTGPADAPDAAVRPRPPRRRRLSREVALAVSAAVAAVAVTCSIVYALALYATLDRRVADDLTAEAERYARIIDEEGLASGELVDFVADQVAFASPDKRLTLIAADGAVVYDSDAGDVSALDNHAMRPEVAAALARGEGATERRSETLGKEAIYHSVRLSDGSVLRVSATQSSIGGVMMTMAVPCAVVLALSLAASALVGWAVSRRVAAGMERIDVDRPLAGDAPEELRPLLARLDDQRRRIDAQAAERREFTANVSHELKTPLTVISGYAEIIEHGIAKPEDVRNFAGLIHDEADHMKSMVEEIIALSRLDEIGQGCAPLSLDGDVSLEDAAEGALSRLRSFAERAHVDLAVKVSRGGAECVRVRGNARILEEMVRNLAENAVRYNHEGGRALVEVAYEEGRAVVRVSDTGRGIPAELRERVFERFYRVDESRSKETGGSGLGLAIVKHAAQLHGASVDVADNDPRGTVITVAFPRG